ncbi:MAG: hypothetical protein ABI415_06565 [Flavitalea sp.]
MKSNNSEGNYEDQPFELPVENELLMLKLRAEFGAECATGNQDIPPDVVNEFLRSVYDFETKFREPCRRVKLFDKIGRPAFKNITQLRRVQVAEELKRLLKIMKASGIELDVLGEYDHAVLYKFLTEELFVHEMDDIELPGYMHHFCYEEFHPNHELDIRRHSIDFLDQWFGRRIDEYSLALGQQFIHPDTRIFSKEQVIRKVQQVFDAYPSFSHTKYTLREVSFKWDASSETGTGYAEGWARYRATNEANEEVDFEGLFSFYFSNCNNWWSIYYFVLPGFSWNQ